MHTIKVRPAKPQERDYLLGLQWRASLTHDAYRDLLLQHPDAIELPIEHIESGGTIVAELDDRVVGFAVILKRSGDVMELDGLFVEPERSRSGIGRRLVEEARKLAIEAGALRMLVVAAPETRAFYDGCGFVLIGETATRFATALVMSMEL